MNSNRVKEIDLKLHLLVSALLEQEELRKTPLNIKRVSSDSGTYVLIKGRKLNQPRLTCYEGR